MFGGWFACFEYVKLSDSYYFFLHFKIIIIILFLCVCIVTMPHARVNHDGQTLVHIVYLVYQIDYIQ